MMAKSLTLMDVRDMDLEHLALEGVQRIEDGDRSVGEGARIDDDRPRRPARLMGSSR